MYSACGEAATYIEECVFLLDSYEFYGNFMFKVLSLHSTGIEAISISQLVHHPSRLWTMM